MTTLLSPPPGPAISLVPDPNGLPGESLLQHVANGIGFWALVAAMIGIVAGAIMWAFGHYSQNYQQAYNGRRGVIVSAVAAILIGAAPYLINQLFLKGAGI